MGRDKKATVTSEDKESWYDENGRRGEQIARWLGGSMKSSPTTLPLIASRLVTGNRCVKSSGWSLGL